MKLTVVIDMNDNVFNELQKKHPDHGPICENTLLNGPAPRVGRGNLV